jgi:hypothetical protein
LFGEIFGGGSANTWGCGGFGFSGSGTAPIESAESSSSDLKVFFGFTGS